MTAPTRMSKERLPACKRGHAANRMRMNSQGYYVCRDCHEQANQRYRKRVNYGKRPQP